MFLLFLVFFKCLFSKKMAPADWNSTYSSIPEIFYFLMLSLLQEIKGHSQGIHILRWREFRKAREHRSQRLPLGQVTWGQGRQETTPGSFAGKRSDGGFLRKIQFPQEANYKNHSMPRQGDNGDLCLSQPQGREGSLITQPELTLPPRSEKLL